MLETEQDTKNSNLKTLGYFSNFSQVTYNFYTKSFYVGLLL